MTTETEQNEKTKELNENNFKIQSHELIVVSQMRAVETNLTTPLLNNVEQITRRETGGTPKLTKPKFVPQRVELTKNEKIGPLDG